MTEKKLTLEDVYVKIVLYGAEQTTNDSLRHNRAQLNPPKRSGSPLTPADADRYVAAYRQYESLSKELDAAISESSQKMNDLACQIRDNLPNELIGIPLELGNEQTAVCRNYSNFIIEFE